MNQADLFGASTRVRKAPPTPRRGLSGRFLKEAGQQRALDGAGSDWSQTIIALLRDWLLPRQGQRIVFEDFRAQVPLDSHPQSPKAWGALPAMACRAKLIEATGEYARAKSPRTHAHPVALWRVL